MNKSIFSFAGAILSLCMFSCCCGPKEAPVTMTWDGCMSETKPGLFQSTFTITNTSKKAIGNDWEIFYCQLPRTIVQDEDATVLIENVNGNYLKLKPTSDFKGIAPGESVQVISYYGYAVVRNSDAPEGTYWVGSDGKALPVEMTRNPLPNPESLAGYPDASKIFDANLRIAQRPAVSQSDILPFVKNAKALDGEAVCLDEVWVEGDKMFESEMNLLRGKLADVYGVTLSESAPVKIILAPLAEEAAEEYYVMRISDNQVIISASDAHGVFNGTQTLLAMMKGEEKPYELQPVLITDQPDLGYRGVMMDVVRNYTTPENMKRLVDILASYKMNVLHFHFNDDEGWRLEIPGLEELTEVGGHRGHTTDESECLYPAYSGGCSTEFPSLGSGYFTRGEFIDFLKFAAERHVDVIPEIETPGHARAAIVSMKARYNKYKDTDPAKAEEYLLTEFADSSVYKSVQFYDDNVLNVALPSTYRFLEKVVTEIAAMYKDAGVELKSIHLGGDEVAAGAWMKSPACQALMAEKGMTKRHDLAEYFITNMAQMLAKHGIKTSGWQEVGLGHSEEGHKIMTDNLYSVNCWTGQSNFKQHYQLANSGVPVVVSCVSNFYMDMAYNGHPEEWALDWGGYVDEATSFSMLPFDIYRSLRGYTVKGDLKLTEEGAKNIIGVSGQLFAETIRNFDMVEYYLFPKMMGLADRGWNVHPSWEALSGDAEAEAYDKALALYYEVISKKEMPAWKNADVDFRLPMPGLQINDGKLYANVAIDGAEIRYTLDGTEPTAESALWTAPVACNGETVRAKAFYLGRESHAITLK